MDIVSSGEKEIVRRSVTVVVAVVVGSRESVADTLAVEDTDPLPLTEASDAESIFESERDTDTENETDNELVGDFVTLPCSDSETDLVTKFDPVMLPVDDPEMVGTVRVIESECDWGEVLDGDVD